MEQKTDTRTMLLTGHPYRLMISLSLPAIIGMVVIGLYNFMDAVFVGQLVSSQAMTAVKISYPFTLFNSGISTLIGVGSASVLSRAIGEKDQNTVDKIMGNLIASVFLLSTIIMVLGIIFARQLLSLAGAKGEIMELAVSYLRIAFLGSVFVNFAQSANMVMRGEGLLKRAMLIMGIGALLNIILDPIIISIMQRSGKGANGAALATVMAQIIQAMITLWYFLKKSEHVCIHNIAIDRVILKAVLGVGISAMLMQVMQMVQQTIMYHVAQQYGGNEWQTILGATLSLQAFAFIPLWGISQGFQPAAGTNYGAKDFERVKAFTKAFVIGVTGLSLLFYIPIMSAPKTMLSMFITDADIVTMGAGSLRLLFSTYITLGVMIITITFFQSIGKGGKAALLTLLRQIVLFIPLAFILPKVGGLGVTGIFLAPVVTDVCILLMSLIMMMKEFQMMKKETTLEGKEFFV